MTRADKLAQAFSGVAVRAAIFEYPVREMQARGWIATTDDTAELEREMCRFFRVPTVWELPNSFERNFGMAEQERNRSQK